jgi:hypothetical protein
MSFCIDHCIGLNYESVGEPKWSEALQDRRTKTKVISRRFAPPNAQMSVQSVAAVVKKEGRPLRDLRCDRQPTY